LLSFCIISIYPFNAYLWEKYYFFANPQSSHGLTPFPPHSKTSNIKETLGGAGGVAQNKTKTSLDAMY
jgi:hypothetical protein